MVLFCKMLEQIDMRKILAFEQCEWRISLLLLPRTQRRNEIILHGSEDTYVGKSKPFCETLEQADVCKSVELQHAERMLQKLSSSCCGKVGGISLPSSSSSTNKLTYTHGTEIRTAGKLSSNRIHILIVWEKSTTVPFHCVLLVLILAMNEKRICSKLFVIVISFRLICLFGMSVGTYEVLMYAVLICRPADLKIRQIVSLIQPRLVQFNEP